MMQSPGLCRFTSVRALSISENLCAGLGSIRQWFSGALPIGTEILYVSSTTIFGVLLTPVRHRDLRHPKDVRRVHPVREL